jgi:hypothetical protein
LSSLVPELRTSVENTYLNKDVTFVHSQTSMESLPKHCPVFLLSSFATRPCKELSKPLRIASDNLLRSFGCQRYRKVSVQVAEIFYSAFGPQGYRGHTFEDPNGSFMMSKKLTVRAV